MKKLIGLIACIMLLGLSSVFAQSKEVTGTITDMSGLGMPGVSVSIKGTTEGTNTDIDGKWGLTVSSKDVLIVSFVGMKTQEITVGDKTVINVRLEDDRVAVEEVVVVAYGTAKKSSFTGSADQISSEDLTKTPLVSVDQALSGLSSGVQVSGGSGQPGASPSIRIRGIGSISSSNEPLYVIDGVAMVGGNMSESSSNSNLGGLSAINPSDIASMTVLKDAAAAALYGSRAANGVVLITTKRGKTGETKFTLKAEYGSTDFAGKPLELATPKEAFDYKVEGYKNYLVEYEGTDAATALATAKKDIADYFSAYDPTRPDSDYDWGSDLFRTGNMKNIQFSASGGSEKTKYFASLGYIKSEGVAKGSDFARISGRLSVDQKATDVISFGFSSMISNMDQNSIPTQGTFYANPLYATRGYLNQLTPVRDVDGNFSEVEGGQKPNLVAQNNLNKQNTNIWKNMNQAYLTLSLMEGLTFKSTNSMDLWQIYGHKYWSPKSTDGDKFGGYIAETNKRRLKLASSNILTYSKTIEDVHNFDFLVGYEVEQLSDQTTAAIGINLPNDEKDHLDVAAKPKAVSSNKDGDRMQSVLSRVNYNYDNKYYFSASYRTDASSRLGDNNRWGSFYSVSGSWRISQEDFMQDVAFVNDWKLRSSFGANGTLPTSWVGALGLYSYGYDYNGVPGSRYSQIENPDLKWEKNLNFSIATEIKMFDFLTAEVEYFRKKTTDLLLQVPISRTTGFSSYWDNVGEMSNQGVEISIESQNVNTNDFTWTTGLTLSHYSNTIDKLAGGADITSSFPFILREGESFNSFYLRDWAGVNPENGHGQWYVLKDEKRVDADKDGKWDVTENVSEADKKIVGNGDPLFNGSISNSLNYKGFDLSFMFSFKINGDVYNDQHSNIFDDGSDLNKAVTKVQLDHWTKPGDHSDLPIVSYQNKQHTSYNSSRRVCDGSYLRLKNVTFAYNLPSNLVKKAHLSNARIYVSGVNLLTFSGLDGFDPEASARGVILDNFDFPTLKTYTFGVQVNF